MWSIDNFGDKAICLITQQCMFSNGTLHYQTQRQQEQQLYLVHQLHHVTWLYLTPDRHLVFYGTETTIGDTSTQDDMFVRFSDQEDINTYIPTATNTAGTQRLGRRITDHGSYKEVDAIYVWTDTALFTQRFVGQPFTFAFAQVGTNCGLVGQNACVKSMVLRTGCQKMVSLYAGRLESLPCLVEDFVYDDINFRSGNQMISAGLNNLFGEVIWFYPTSSSSL